jgi:anti-sigma factor RsiW
MSVPHESGRDDQQLVRYLLGLLPDEDAERVEELTFTDEEVAGRVRAVEHDLVDAYVRGTLPAERRQQFEAFYLSSPRRREKVRLAEGFLRTADATGLPAHVNGEAGREAVPDPAASSTRLERDETPPRGPVWYERLVPRVMPAWGLAMAAALLLAAGASLVFVNAQLRQELTQARQASAAADRRAQDLTQQLADQQTAKDDAARELERARASLAELSQRPPSTGQPAGSASPQRDPVRGAPPAEGAVASAARAMTTIAMVLLPQTRAAGAVATLEMPSGTDRVAFELGLESSGFPRYQVALKDPATNQIIWRSGRLAPKSVGDTSSLAITVPARVFKSQHYAFDLTGFNAAGGADLIGSYTFRIVQP